ncbi:hypothetical protein [Mycobacterium gastri]|uniref:Uncharacterized protein n=1 Tax=Mycobacterium gastri TaxID=1777 RepID=A0A1X1URK7_MYCGS|nr:hypothetical protein [Mycobacterium gastri]ETW24725.1 hypothetical protein MGAST_06815 [Mycobacterium gastri 'Wayne']ORV59470.1 hypothetical protein AWC07_19590 [Mycobacterium gastri]
MTVIALDEVGHEVSASLTAYSARLTHRAISTFEYLTNDEIDRGLDQLASDAAAETNPQPVHHTHDLLTLEKRCATREVPIRRAASVTMDRLIADTLRPGRKRSTLVGRRQLRPARSKQDKN